MLRLYPAGGDSLCQLETLIKVTESFLVLFYFIYYKYFNKLKSYDCTCFKNSTTSRTTSLAIRIRRCP
jgi:hypothetical protein